MRLPRDTLRRVVSRGPAALLLLRVVVPLVGGLVLETPFKTSVLNSQREHIAESLLLLAALNGCLLALRGRRGTFERNIAALFQVMALLLLPFPAAPLVVAAANWLMPWRSGRGLRGRLASVGYSLITMGFPSFLLVGLVRRDRFLAGGRLQGGDIVAIIASLFLLYALDARGPAPLDGTRRRWRRSMVFSALPTVTAYALGVVGALLWRAQPFELALLCPMLLTLYAAIDAAARARRHAHALRQILETARELRPYRGSAAILSHIAEAAQSLVDGESVAAYLADPHDPDRLQWILSLPDDTSNDTSNAPPDGPRPRGPATLTVPSGSHLRQASYFQDVDEASSGAIDAAWQPLLVVLHADELSLGALLIQVEEGQVPEHALDALGILGAQGGAALQNAALYAQTVAQLAEDGLTGLQNHRAFGDRLGEAMSEGRGGGGTVGVLYLDIDNFGAVNNACGHEGGDIALVAVAGALRGALAPYGEVARTSGDQFALLLSGEDVSRAREIASAAQMAVSAIRIVESGLSIRVSVSAGLAIAPQHGSTGAHLLHAATRALEAAKARGSGELAFPEDAVVFGDDTDPLLLASQLASSHLSTLEALAAAVDAKDHYTSGHSKRVAAYAAILGETLGLSREGIARVRRAGDVHDIGKIGVPDALLRTSFGLSDEERRIVTEHTIIGERMLAAVPYLRDIMPAVRHHHERWDGTGYPDKLVGASIPLEAAIVSVADSFDAMTTTRTYRPALQLEEACRRLRRAAGTQFDPRVVAAFDEALRTGRLTLLSVEMPIQSTRRRHKIYKRRSPTAEDWKRAERPIPLRPRTWPAPALATDER